MNVLASGTHGLIGSALVGSLRADGHRVVRLVRRPEDPDAPTTRRHTSEDPAEHQRTDADAANEDEVRWDPTTGFIDRGALEARGPFDAAVNLGGAGIGDRRWTVARRRLIVASRREPTRLLANTLATLSPRPEVLVSASAVGYYGDAGSRALPESAASGDGFLAEVCRTWEASTTPATDAGIRVVLLRSGIVLARTGGMLGRLLPLFRLGLGAKLGSGRQYVSWITLRDEVAVIEAAMTDQRLSGPVNAVAPGPVTNAEFTANLGRALHRPSVLAVPSVALRVAAGRELADELLLSGQRAQPVRLQSIGHRFDDPDIDRALASLLGPR